MPKLAVRVVHFERAATEAAIGPSYVSIPQVAAVCARYDHAHLYRDFTTQLAGCTPVDLIREEATFFQDDGMPVDQ